MARGAEGKLRFAARGALAAWPATWRENSASLRAVRGRTALQRRGKIPCCCAVRWQHGPAAWRENSVLLCVVRWQHGPAAWRENSASLRAVRGRTALRRGGKISLCCVWCVAARPCGVEGKLRVSAQCAGSMARGAEGKLRFAVCGALAAWPAARRENSALLCVVRWQHGPAAWRENSALLCVVRWQHGPAARRESHALLCVVRWQHGPAAWRENSVLLRGALAA